MSDQMQTLLKFVLLGGIYIFFARTLWAVWSEVRQPAVAQPGRRGSGQRLPNEMNLDAPAPPVAPSLPMTPMRASKGRSKVSKLVMVEPASASRQTFDLGNELTVGRAPGCGVSIDDTFVSQLHARVYFADGEHTVEDLASTNGTKLNDQPLTKPTVLQLGDRIRLGSTVLECR